MPTPFMCHWCDKPTMNETGICIECEQKYEEGNKDIAGTVRELESRVRWLEDGLKEIASGRDDMNGIYIKQQAQAVLDGEPTTADEHNKNFIQYRDTGDENVVRISDVNKEIAKEWKKPKHSIIQNIGYRGEDE